MNKVFFTIILIFWLDRNKTMVSICFNLDWFLNCIILLTDFVLFQVKTKSGPTKHIKWEHGVEHFETGKLHGLSCGFAIK